VVVGFVAEAGEDECTRGEWIVGYLGAERKRKNKNKRRIEARKEMRTSCTEAPAL